VSPPFTVGGTRRDRVNYRCADYLNVVSIVTGTDPKRFRGAAYEHTVALTPPFTIAGLARGHPGGLIARSGLARLLALLLVARFARSPFYRGLGRFTATFPFLDRGCV
jgi:hypothetical protein